MLVEFGKASLLAKARKHPDRVKQMLQKVKTDGWAATIKAVRTRLDEPMQLGYCNVGVVLAVGDGVTEFQPGDRVVSNGSHAEIVCVPKNLCAKVPEGVPDEAAAFAVLGAIALQGVRLAEPTLGERFVVTGLGLLGQIACQALKANGCGVLGLDLSPERCALARSLGVEALQLQPGEDPAVAAEHFSRGRGVDGVIVTASTASSEPISQAAHMCRKKGRIVLVGVTGLELNRNDFYHKELSFQVSCSYGPGRYDSSYEECGNDYPISHVRWTAQRNFEAFLDLSASGSVQVTPLISHRIPLSDAPRAYDLITSDKSALGVLLEYAKPDVRPDDSLLGRWVELAPTGPIPSGKPVVAMIGAGLYARSVHLPTLKEADVVRRVVAASSGVSSRKAATTYGFSEATTDLERVFGDPQVNTVVIATRHASHAPLLIRGLRAGKHVYVEKPLAIDEDQLEAVIAAYEETRELGGQLMVGFNRRFSPHVVRLKAALDRLREPKALSMTVNAGAIPPDHWTQDPAVGGGRIIGEACHFVDLLRHLAGAPIVSVTRQDLGGTSPPTPDSVHMHLRFEDGSVATLQYLSNGHRSYPKERLEVFCGGRVAVLDNFRTLEPYGWAGFSRYKTKSQDKGQQASLVAFLEAAGSGRLSPIPFSEAVEVTRATFVRQSSNLEP